MSYDVERVRADIPALTMGAAHFDGPGGTQTAGPVIKAVTQAMRDAVSNRGVVTAAERRADAIVVDARGAAGDLLGADPAGVAFGRSMTALALTIAGALARQWKPGDEIVLTTLDHDANFTPWRIAADRVGATARIVEFEPDGTLLPELVIDAINERTKFLAITGASNLIGTRPDLAAIAKAAHAVGATVAVDGVHLTPHAPVDVKALGADLYFCSSYKFCGPHLGLLAARPELLETLHPLKLEVSSEQIPERFEHGTLPYEVLAGLTAGIDWIAGLDDEAEGNRRQRITTSMTTVEAHESVMQQRIESRLRAIDGVSLFATKAPRRTPTTLFTIDGHAPSDIYSELANRDINAPAGTFYASRAAKQIGLTDDGAVRVGVAAYTDTTDVDRLLAAVTEIAND